MDAVAEFCELTALCCAQGFDFAQLCRWYDLQRSVPAWVAYICTKRLNQCGMSVDHRDYKEMPA